MSSATNNLPIPGTKTFSSFNEMAEFMDLIEGTPEYIQQKEWWDNNRLPPKVTSVRRSSVNSTPTAGGAPPEPVTLEDHKLAFNAAARVLRAAEGAVRAFLKHSQAGGELSPQHGAALSLLQADAAAAKGAYNRVANALNQMRKPSYTKHEKLVVARMRAATREEYDDIVTWAGGDPHEVDDE